MIIHINDKNVGDGFLGHSVHFAYFYARAAKWLCVYDCVCYMQEIRCILT